MQYGHRRTSRPIPAIARFSNSPVKFRAHATGSKLLQPLQKHCKRIDFPCRLFRMNCLFSQAVNEKQRGPKAHAGGRISSMERCVEPPFGSLATAYEILQLAVHLVTCA